MNKILSATLSVCLATFLGAFLLFQAGCEIESGDETVRTVSLDIAGSYTNNSGIPDRQSGNRITQLTLIQNGDQLTGVDNQGGRWTGTIGRAGETQASITLDGMTSAGAQVVITGTVTVNGSDATLSGLWVEPGITANVSATGSVTPSPTATPSATSTPTVNVTATPTPVLIITPTPTPVP